MPEYVSSTTNMIAGTLIGITFMGTIVACCCTLLLYRRQNSGAKEAPGATQPALQGQPEKTKAEKVAPAEVIKEHSASKMSLFSFRTRKKKTTENQATQPVVESTPKLSESIKPTQTKLAKQVKEKQPKTPKLKAVKEAKKAVAKASQKYDPRTEKGRWFGLFMRKEAAQAKEVSVSSVGEVNKPATGSAPVPTAAPTENASQQGVDETVKPTAATTSAQAPTAQITAPVASPAHQVAVPNAQLAGGNAAPDSQATAQPEPAAEPEKPKEASTDSVFNLFTDSVGEESEISKFASNFDNVSLDSLLGEGQGLLDRLHKK